MEKSFRLYRDWKKKARATKSEVQKAGKTEDQKRIKKENSIKAKSCKALDEIVRNTR